MPTGYTAKLMEEGQAFPEFVMTCARAMGAGAMLRDEPLGATWPEFEPSSHYKHSIDEARDELERLTTMNEAERLQYGVDAKAEEIARYEVLIASDEEQNQRLIGMRKQVEAWDAPTPDHDGLKSFMLQQIGISKQSSSYAEESLARARLANVEDYHPQALQEQAESLEWYAKEYAKEVQRTKERNAWVRALRESILQ